MRVINLMLDSRSGNLSLDIPSATEVYNQLRSSIASFSSLTQTAIDSWIEVFYQLDETGLSTVSRASSNPDCWKLFLDLCNLLISRTVDTPQYSSSIVLQTRHKALCEARRRLRISSVIYIELEGKVSQQVTSRAPSLSPNSLLKELQKAVKK